MDYHFFRNENESLDRGFLGSGSSIFSIIKRFFPILVLAISLPFFIVLAMSPSELSFLTRADESLQLRLWFEPNNIILDPGDEAELSVWASFDSDKKLVPTITVPVFADVAGVEILDKEVLYREPFNGKVELGKVRVRALASGQYKVFIEKDDIKIVALTDDVEIIPSHANLIVR